jgi:hypothetical protein
MDRNERISRLVNRKLAAGTQAMGCVPCFGIGGRQKAFCMPAVERRAKAAPKK